MRQALLALAPAGLLLLAGCPRSEVVQLDAGPVTKSRAACEPEDTEDCRGCFESIGDCCYEDAQIFGRVQMLVDRCNGVPSCRACCNECKRMTCAQLLAAHNCPNK